MQQVIDQSLFLKRKGEEEESKMLSCCMGKEEVAAEGSLRRGEMQESADLLSR